jgi:hypothetical protein
MISKDAGETPDAAIEALIFPIRLTPFVLVSWPPLLPSFLIVFFECPFAFSTL